MCAFRCPPQPRFLRTKNNAVDLRMEQSSQHITPKAGTVRRKKSPVEYLRIIKLLYVKMLTNKIKKANDGKFAFFTEKEDL